MKSLGKASSFTKIYGIRKDFPDLTLYMENIFWANYGSNTLTAIKKSCEVVVPLGTNLKFLSPRKLCAKFG